MDDVCANTRAYRYENCAPFLKTEIENAGPTCCLVAIGNAPKEFLERHDWYGKVVKIKHIHRIEHYGFFRTKFFQDFARDNEAAYATFKNEWVPQYEEFLHREDRPKADRFRVKPDYDMSRIFKYSYELMVILECPLCSSQL